MEKMRKMVFVSGLALFLLLSGVSYLNAQPGKQPVAGLKGLGDDDKLLIDPKDKCPVCAMKPAKNPKFATALVLDDGKTYYFCGTGCMMWAWLNTRKTIGVDQSKIERVVVKDFFSGRSIDGKRAIWVADSKLMGPMGKAIVPLSTLEDAKVFKKRHGGRITFRFSELTPKLLAEITQKK